MVRSDGGIADLTLGDVSLPRKRDFVYQSIKADLASGKYEPGQPLVIVELAKAFGTSRQPVLEALKRLDKDGFVEIVPQVGVRTIRPKPAWVLDFYRVFGNVEGLAAEMAAERVTPGGLEELRSRTTTMDERVAVGTASMVDYLALNRRVHAAIHAMTGSTEVIRAAQAYWDKSDFLIATTYQSSSGADLHQVSHGHDGIVAAVEKGDAVQARQLATEHLLSAGRILANELKLAE